MRHVLEPEDGLGHGFIMGFVEGETLGGRIVRSEAFAGARTFLARQCGEILARIHTMDPDDVPAACAARRRPSWSSSTSATYRRRAWPRPVFDLAFRWLDAHCPPPTRAK